MTATNFIQRNQFFFYFLICSREICLAMLANFQGIFAMARKTSNRGGNQRKHLTHEGLERSCPDPGLNLGSPSCEPIVLPLSHPIQNCFNCFNPIAVNLGISFNDCKFGTINVTIPNKFDFINEINVIRIRHIL